jgi:7-cyano-7-deazaguanine synthase
MPKHRRAVVTVLLSGGIDSSGCVNFYLRQRLAVSPLFVDYGQPASRAEFSSARAICLYYRLPLKTITVKGLAIPDCGEIPGRNLFLIGTALTVAGYKSNLIALGIHRGTRYFDCNRVFTKLCQRLLDGYSDGRVLIAAPFLRMSKTEVWEYCKRSCVPLHLTWSCEARNVRPCGKCLSCKDKEFLLARA